MKILCLYNNKCALELFEWLKEQGNDIVLADHELVPDWCRENKFDLAVSYTYRYILTEEILAALDHNAVNLHNSFLPFNRGASPNIWSIAENTPRGVTLHYMDKDLDKGYIIAQKFVIDSDEETLSGSYDNLDAAAKELFKEAFFYYRHWEGMKKKAVGRGTYHSVSDLKRIEGCFDSYDDTVKQFKGRIEESKTNI